MHAIHNARVQLLATALNNLGVGSMLTGIVVPWINGNLSGGVAGWYVFAVLSLITAQVVLWEDAMMDPSAVPWIGSAIVGVFLVVLLARQALRRRKHRHPVE